MSVFEEIPDTFIELKKHLTTYTQVKLTMVSKYFKSVSDILRPRKYKEETYTVRVSSANFARTFDISIPFSKYCVSDDPNTYQIFNTYNNLDFITTIIRFTLKVSFSNELTCDEFDRFVKHIDISTTWNRIKLDIDRYYIIDDRTISIEIDISKCLKELCDDNLYIIRGYVRSFVRDISYPFIIFFPCYDEVFNIIDKNHSWRNITNAQIIYTEQTFAVLCSETYLKKKIKQNYIYDDILELYYKYGTLIANTIDSN